MVNYLKSIILAAGEGRRLRPLTENNPKCMVNLFGKSLLQRQIEVMKSCGIDEIVIVTGYKSEMIKFPDIHYVRNENY